MPEKTEAISVTGYDENRLMVLAYGALKSLDWTIKYVLEKQIIAYTPRSWNKYDHEIHVEIAGEQLTVTSKHIHGELADLPGRNKKFLEQFFAAFESVKGTATEEQLNTWNERIASLQTETIIIAKQEIKESEEIDTVMNLSKSNLYVTYAIIALNVIVFIMMVVSGVPLLTPTGLDIINWGGNYSTLTLSGDWWRLVSCVFVHIGIIHLLFNMYALYMIGVYLEPMLGKARFIAAYLATGVFASLASLWWHDDPVPSAGASGAIFGMYGVFLALLTTKLIPKQVRDSLFKSISVFIVFNLIYGMKSGIDNAAHVGGLLGGLVIGYVYYLTWNSKGTFKKIIVPLVIIGVVIVVTSLYINNNQISQMTRRQFYYEVEIMRIKETTKFKSNLNEIDAAEERINEIMDEYRMDNATQYKKIDDIVLPEIRMVLTILEKAKQGEVSKPELQKVNLLQQYYNLRIEEAELTKKYLSGNKEGNEKYLDENYQKKQEIVKRIRELQ